MYGAAVRNRSAALHCKEDIALKTYERTDFPVVANGNTEIEKDYYIELITTDIYRVMREKNISKADLARIMDTSPANITQILNGSRNFTLGKLVEIAHALDAKLSIGIANRSARGQYSAYDYSPFSFGSEELAVRDTRGNEGSLFNTREDAHRVSKEIEGVTVLNILLKELSLKRNSFPGDHIEYDYSTEIGICPLKDQNYAEVILKGSISGKKERCVQLDISILGMFRIDDPDKMNIGMNEFLHVTAADIIYPYLKNVANKTVQCAEITPINLPEYDFRQMYEDTILSQRRLKG